MLVTAFVLMQIYRLHHVLDGGVTRKDYATEKSWRLDASEVARRSQF